MSVIIRYDIDDPCPYSAARHGDTIVLYVNPDRAADLPHWLREYLSNQVLDEAQHRPTGVPQPVAPVIDLDQRRARRDLAATS
jgi:hypothetical protein